MGAAESSVRVCTRRLVVVRLVVVRLVVSGCALVG